MILDFYLNTEKALSALAFDDSIRSQSAMNGLSRNYRNLSPLQHPFGNNVEIFRVDNGYGSCVYAVNRNSGKVYTLYGAKNEILRFYLDHYRGTFLEFCRSTAIDGVDLQCYRKYLKKECQQKSVTVNNNQFPCITEEWVVVR